MHMMIRVPLSKMSLPLLAGLVMLCLGTVKADAAADESCAYSIVSV